MIVWTHVALRRCAWLFMIRLAPFTRNYSIPDTCSVASSPLPLNLAYKEPHYKGHMSTAVSNPTPPNTHPNHMKPPNPHHTHAGTCATRPRPKHFHPPNHSPVLWRGNGLDKGVRAWTHVRGAVFHSSPIITHLCHKGHSGGSFLVKGDSQLGHCWTSRAGDHPPATCIAN